MTKKKPFLAVAVAVLAMTSSFACSPFGDMGSGPLAPSVALQDSSGDGKVVVQSNGTFSTQIYMDQQRGLTCSDLSMVLTPGDHVVPLGPPNDSVTCIGTKSVPAGTYTVTVTDHSQNNIYASMFGCGGDDYHDVTGSWDVPSGGTSETCWVNYFYSDVFPF